MALMPCVLPGEMLQGLGALWGCPLWLAVSHLPILSLGSISPLPLQMDACMSGWPFPHDIPEGTEPEGEGRSWQLQEGSRCAWVMLPWNSQLALSAAGRHCLGRTPCTAQVVLSAGTGTAGMSFGTVFKAWAFWIQNLSPPQALVLSQFFFNSPRLFLMAFSGCCHLPEGLKEKK